METERLASAIAACGRKRQQEMKNPILLLTLALAVMLCLSACGKKYTCYQCGTETGKAYYDYNANKESVLCEDCARSYWMPLDYSNYRVK